MNEKQYTVALFVCIAVCVLLTLLHLSWAAGAYGRSSIIWFIAQEVWP